MNIRLQKERQLKRGLLKPSDFRTLPSGVKRMLSFSEAYFSERPKSEQDQHPPMTISGRRRPLTFGDFVAGVYRTWGQPKAKGIVQLAVKMNMVEFRGPERFVFS
jgi:hypothetical protein